MFSNKLQLQTQDMRRHANVLLYENVSSSPKKQKCEERENANNILIKCYPQALSPEH